ncbi:class II glutamine amidotransferase [Microbacterium sp. AZCO]|uniref:class II glutamine amidotransferase n=1 Tax=Microbacterium sp. AZCO TaxID=3142976 RepID=UPI0031F38F17
MSRMLAFAARTPLPTAAAVGADVLAQFRALSRLHADGWGTAWLDPASRDVMTAGGRDAAGHSDEWETTLSRPSAARIVYLRFASGGAPASPENAQPFLRNGTAFQHNGLLAPREDALALLTEEARSGLTGTTDSEAYFAVVRGATGGGSLTTATELAHGVRLVRDAFPVACLNAMLLTPAGLFVVHAAGSAPVPLAAFARRGADMSNLPPGHDDDYNVLRTSVTLTGARVVATTGVDQSGWDVLDTESVLRVTPDAVIGTEV